MHLTRSINCNPITRLLSGGSQVTTSARMESEPSYKYADLQAQSSRSFVPLPHQEIESVLKVGMHEHMYTYMLAPPPKIHSCSVSKPPLPNFQDFF